MKLLIVLIWPLLLLDYGRTNLYEQGVIEYKVEMEMSDSNLIANQDFIISLLEELEMKIYFNKDEVRTDMVLEELYQLKSYINRSNGESVMYMDFFGRRIKSKPQNIPTFEMDIEASISENLNSIKNIAGLPAHEMTISWPNDSGRSSITTFVSNQLEFEFMGFGMEAFAGMKKVPLEYTLKNEQFKLRIFATKFSTDIKSSVFKRPAGYETKELEEIGSLLGNSPFFKSFGN